MPLIFERRRRRLQDLGARELTLVVALPPSSSKARQVDWSQLTWGEANRGWERRLINSGGGCCERSRGRGEGAAAGWPTPDRLILRAGSSADRAGSWKGLGVGPTYHWLAQPFLLRARTSDRPNYLREVATPSRAWRNQQTSAKGSGRGNRTRSSKVIKENV